MGCRRFGFLQSGCCQYPDNVTDIGVHTFSNENRLIIIEPSRFYSEQYVKDKDIIFQQSKATARMRWPLQIQEYSKLLFKVCIRLNVRTHGQGF